MSLFPSTSWSLVLSAGETGATASNGALAQLCEAYWRPLYVYARGRGFGIEDAADSTQGYFATLLEKRYVRDARADRGRFRAFLLTSFRHYLANEFDKQRAQKRGGGLVAIPFAVESAERNYSIEPSHRLTPDKLFERQWAVTLIGRALSCVQNDMETLGKGAIFEEMRVHLTGEGSEQSYEEQASRHGMTAGAFKTEVHRLRKRFRSAVREQVAATIESPDQIDEELRFLFEALAD
jgi:RNA polymerase sigma-70 factor (ECF subfamily)